MQVLAEISDVSRAIEAASRKVVKNKYDVEAVSTKPTPEGFTVTITLKSKVSVDKKLQGIPVALLSFKDGATVFITYFMSYDPILGKFELSYRAKAKRLTKVLVKQFSPDVVLNMVEMGTLQKVSVKHFLDRDLTITTNVKIEKDKLLPISATKIKSLMKVKAAAKVDK